LQEHPHLSLLISSSSAAQKSVLFPGNRNIQLNVFHPITETTLSWVIQPSISLRMLGSFGTKSNKWRLIWHGSILRIVGAPDQDIASGAYT
jgi:hypothetical protein